MKNLIQREETILPPGYIAVSRKPALLCTVSGNGVVVVVWDRARRIGGMVQCIFARCGGRRPATNYAAAVAVPLLLQAMRRQGAGTYTLKAQIVGGGHLQGHARQRAVGVVKEMVRIFRAQGIPVLSDDIGGTVGRKVMFDTYSGDLMILKTQNIRNSDWMPERLFGTRG